MMRPTITDLALTMRGGIASALADDAKNGWAGLLGDLDLGLQAISTLACADAGKSPDGARALLPSPRDPAGDALPHPGRGPFEDYLRDRTNSPELRLDAVSRISGGFSRDMIRLHCTIGTQAREIVLRREVPGGLLDGIGIGVAGEYPLIEIARLGGVPVAAPRWLENDPAILGQPFIAMDCAAGVCLGTSLGAARQIGHPQLHALAGMLARLHQADWRPLSRQSDLGHGSATANTALLDRWDGYRRMTPMAKTPLLDDAMDWLRNYLPSDGQAPCLTHGDVGFHNIMADDDGFTALLDWEMAVIASPAKDIAHIRPSVEQMVEWETFTGWYREAGGPHISEAELHWFEIFRAFSMTLVCHVALARLADPVAARLDYFRLGFVALPFFSQHLETLLSKNQPG